MDNQQGHVPSGVQVGPAISLCAAGVSSFRACFNFKVAKRTVENRYSLKSENVEMLLFMKYNLRFLNFRY